MPELPEVETVRAQLEPVLMGRRFERVEIRDPRLVRPYEPAEVAAELEGERVASVERRGKYLIVRFESERVLLIHLRMTGSLRHGPRGVGADDPYVAQRLGVEPLAAAFTARELAARAGSRRAPIKAVLLDQRALAGVGNIY